MTTINKAKYTLEEARQILICENTFPLPVLDQPELVREYMALRVAKLEVEKFWVLCLDRKNRLIECVEVTSGTASQCLIHPREVFRPAIVAGASAVICVHNHPSGDPTPSAADIKATRQLKDAGAVLGIDFLDHVICGEKSKSKTGKDYYSFSEFCLV